MDNIEKSHFITQVFYALTREEGEATINRVKQIAGDDIDFIAELERINSEK